MAKNLVETKDESILSKVPSHWIKQNTISVEGSDISLLIQCLSLSLGESSYLCSGG